MIRKSLRSIGRIGLIRIAAVAAAIGASPVVAQETTGGGNATPTGQYYVAETFRDWERICLNSGGAEDPCHMYQLLEDANGHPTAELAVFSVDEEEGISAAANIMTPLQTLLTSELVFEIDDGTRANYPFSYCDQRGCHVRIALTDDDVFAMKKGSTATITIESVTAPGKAIALQVSLQGFTRAFGSLQRPDS